MEFIWNMEQYCVGGMQFSAPQVNLPHALKQFFSFCNSSIHKSTTFM